MSFAMLDDVAADRLGAPRMVVGAHIRRLLGAATVVAAVLQSTGNPAVANRPLQPEYLTGTSKDSQRDVIAEASDPAEFSAELLKARNLNNYALTLQHRGRTKEAQDLYEQCLNILEAAVGIDHPTYAGVLLNLAATYQSQNRISDAERLYKHTLAALAEKLGDEHYVMGFNLNNLGMLYLREGRYADAEESINRGLSLLEKGLGPDNLATVASRHNLALLYEQIELIDRAKELYAENVTIIDRMAKPNVPALITVLARLQALYTKDGRNTEANGISARIRELTVRMHGP